MKYLLMLTLTLTKAHELEALVTFVIFQKKYRLESLTVMRDKYWRLEKRLNYTYIFFVAAVTLPSPFLMTYELIFSPESKALF